MSNEQTSAPQDQQAEAGTFQARVDPWMQACFGAEVSADRLERGDRLLEEVLELLQSGSYPPERVASLTGYVYSRDIGDPAQEVGGVMVTLAAYCLAHGLNMHEAGEDELARVWTKVEKIRAKQAAKPKGSALPQAWPTPQAEAAPSRDEALWAENERLREFISSFRISVNEASFYKDVSMHLDAPHSLSLRVPCSSDKSWIFADLEKRRIAALEDRT